MRCAGTRAGEAWGCSPEKVVLALDRNFSWSERRTDSIESAMTQLDGVGPRLDGVGTRLDGVVTQLDGVASRLDGGTTPLDGFTTQLESHPIRTPPDPTHRQQEPRQDCQRPPWRRNGRQLRSRLRVIISKVAAATPKRNAAQRRTHLTMGTLHWPPNAKSRRYTPSRRRYTRRSRSLGRESGREILRNRTRRAWTTACTMFRLWGGTLDNRGPEVCIPSWDWWGERHQSLALRL